jgi:hypothetical protein
MSRINERTRAAGNGKGSNVEASLKASSSNVILPGTGPCGHPEPRPVATQMCRTCASIVRAGATVGGAMVPWLAELRIALTVNCFAVGVDDPVLQKYRGMFMQRPCPLTGDDSGEGDEEVDRVLARVRARRAHTLTGGGRG